MIRGSMIYVLCNYCVITTYLYTYLVGDGCWLFYLGRGCILIGMGEWLSIYNKYRSPYHSYQLSVISYQLSI